MNNINTIVMKISVLLLCAFLVLIASCEKEPYINFGFDSPIEKNSDGIGIAHISRNDEKIYLTELSVYWKEKCWLIL